MIQFDHDDTKAQSRPRRPNQIPLLEVLEDRTAPATAVFHSTDVPVEIIDNTTVTSTITVDESFLPTDLDVTLDIDHTFDSDLNVFLTGPDGTRIELFTAVGGGGENFRNTTLDDEAPISIGNGTAPFSGSFRPEGVLSAFESRDVEGTWTLEITDTFPGDTGTLNNWSLDFDFGAVEPGEIRGTKWLDRDGDGIRQPEEPGIAGVTLFLDRNGNEQLDSNEPSTRTGADGSYSFTDLVPGNYSVFEVQSLGLTQTFPTPPVELFRADFENGGAGFTVSGNASQWHLSSGRANDEGHSPSTSAYFGSGEGAFGGGTYQSNANGTLFSPVIDLTSFGGPLALEFNHFLEAEDNFDFAEVGVLANGTFTTLASSDPAKGGLLSNTDGFAEVTLDLSAFAGQRIQIVFQFTSDSIFNFEGWYVDDIAVLVPGERGHEVTVGAGQTVSGLDFGNQGLGNVTGDLDDPNDQDLFTFTLQESVRLTAEVTATSGTLLPVITLLGETDQILVQSNSAFEQHLLPGTWSFSVSAQAGTGSYQLTTDFVQANPPLDRPEVGTSPTSVVAADVDGDGFTDLINANSRDNSISVLLGNNDGTFRAQQTFAVGPSVFGTQTLTAADLDEDGNVDILISNRNSVGVLLGNGDGTFQAMQVIAAGSPSSVAVADVDADTRLDVIFTSFNNTVSVLLGNGDGTFQAPRIAATGQGPTSVAIGDVDGDTRLDLLVVNSSESTVGVLLGNGDGTFGLQKTFATDLGPTSVDVADVNGDNDLDVVVANTAFGNFDPRTVGVLLGNGDGTFEAQETYPVGTNPASIVAGDTNDDGTPDLVVANLSDNTVSVLLGVGDGTFLSEVTYFIPGKPLAATFADVTSDGNLDLIATNFGFGEQNAGQNVSVLLGNGDGSFRNEEAISVGPGPTSIAVADFNGDGIPDAASSIVGNQTVDIELGNGDGSFSQLKNLDVGVRPNAVAAADLNRDGKQDLVVANLKSDTVSVLLGIGDGSFLPEETYGTEVGPTELVVGDLNEDGIPDIVVANNGDNSVSVLFGTGDGTFLPEETLAAGQGPGPGFVGDLPGAGPLSVTLMDVNVDGHQDIVVVSTRDRSVIVLPGNGDGTFENQTILFAGPSPFNVATDDINNDGRPDLVVANFDSTVHVLLANGDGTFVDQTTTVGPTILSRFAVQDLNVDGNLDLVVTNFNQKTVGVLLGNGDGTFGAQQQFRAGDGTLPVAVADINGDGKPDVLAGNFSDNTMSVLVGDGEGLLFPVTPSSGVPIRSTPFLANLSGHSDGTLDSVILDRAGTILFRKGIPGDESTFSPPVSINDQVLNEDSGTTEKRVARDLTLLSTGEGTVIATADSLLEADRQANDVQFVYSVSLYAHQEDGAFLRTTAFTTERAPTRIVAGNLTSPIEASDGLDDLVVANSLDDTITISFQTAPGEFDSAPLVRAVGLTPSDIALTDVDGDGLLDIVVTNQGGGDVSVLFNDVNQSFTREARYRGGIGTFGLDLSSSTSQVSSLNQSVSLTAGDFTGSGFSDLLIVNRGAHSFSVLPNNSQGGFFNTDARLTMSTSEGLAINNQAGQVVSADFDRDGNLDSAILMQDQNEVWLYRGLGDGTFTLASRTGAGNAPTGLSVADINQDGNLDLLVGNGFGDVLFVLGEGDGTFRAFVRADQAVPFVTTDLDGDGAQDVILANQSQDLALAQIRTGDSFTQGEFQQANDDGLISPGDVLEADLDGINGTDLIFANSGSNNVLVYLRQADGTFAEDPLSFFSGTNPVALHVANLNGDIFLDLVVANQGSNDVNVFLGSRGEDTNRDGVIDGQDLFRPGPRLSTNGFGPNAVSSQDMDGDGILDLVATNGQSGTLAIIPGIGNNSTGTGFFDDGNITNVQIAPGPIQQTQLINATLGFTLTQGGAVRSFNPTAGTAATVFTPGVGREANAIQAIPTATSFFLFTANRDGSASLLTPETGGNLTEQVSVLNGSLGNPSALQVLQGDTGLFEIYVTDAGESQPVVLTLTIGTDVSIVGSPFAVAVTLFTGVPAEVGTLTTGTGLAQIFNPLFVGEGTAITLREAETLAELEDTDIIQPAGTALLGELGELVNGDITEVSLEDEEDQLKEEDSRSTEDPEELTEDPASLLLFLNDVQNALDRLEQDDAPEEEGKPDGQEAPDEEQGPEETDSVHRDSTHRDSTQSVAPQERLDTDLPVHSQRSATPGMTTSVSRVFRGEAELKTVSNTSAFWVSPMLCAEHRRFWGLTLVGLGGAMIVTESHRKQREGRRERWVRRPSPRAR